MDPTRSIALSFQVQESKQDYETILSPKTKLIDDFAKSLMKISEYVRNQSTKDVTDKVFLPIMTGVIRGAIFGAFLGALQAAISGDYANIISETGHGIMSGGNYGSLVGGLQALKLNVQDYKKFEQSGSKELRNIEILKICFNLNIEGPLKDFCCPFTREFITEEAVQISPTLTQNRQYFSKSNLDEYLARNRIERNGKIFHRAKCPMTGIEFEKEHVITVSPEEFNKNLALACEKCLLDEALDKKLAPGLRLELLAFYRECYTKAQIDFIQEFNQVNREFVSEKIGMKEYGLRMDAICRLFSFPEKSKRELEEKLQKEMTELRQQFDNKKIGSKEFEERSKDIGHIYALASEIKSV